MIILRNSGLANRFFILSMTSFNFYSKTTELVAKDYPKNETEMLAEISKQVRLESGLEDEQETGYS